MRARVFCCIVAGVICLAAIAGQAMAGTVTFSGRTWTTLDSLATAQYEPDQWNEYSGAGNTGIITGRFGVDSAMTTSLTLNVGDKVSYDYFVTEVSRDLGGDGSYSTWFSDTGTAFYGSGGQVTHRNLRLSSSRWEDYWISPSWSYDGYVYKPRSATQSTHIEWVFDTATSATVTLTLQGETTPYATWTDSFSNIADITNFRVGLWDSEQDVTLSNFTVTLVPEPSSLVALALGASSLLAICRRSRKEF